MTDAELIAAMRERAAEMKARAADFFDRARQLRKACIDQQRRRQELERFGRAWEYRAGELLRAASSIETLHLVEP